MKKFNFLIIFFCLTGCLSFDYKNTKFTSEGVCLRQTTPKEQFFLHIYPKTYCMTSDDCPNTYMCDRSYNVCEATIRTNNIPDLYQNSRFKSNSCFSNEDCFAFESCIKRPLSNFLSTSCDYYTCPESFSCSKKFKVCIKD